jgi:hypothetical protein
MPHLRQVCPDVSQEIALPSSWPSGPIIIAVPKERVYHIGVSGERTLSFRKATFLGPLDLEDEVNTFLLNVGKCSCMNTASHFKILQSSTALLLQPQMLQTVPISCSSDDQK